MVLNQGGVKITSAKTRNNILIAPESSVAMSIKIFRRGDLPKQAGSIVYAAPDGLKNRNNPMAVAGTLTTTEQATWKPVGVLLHNTDEGFNEGDQTLNASLVIVGVIDVEKLDPAVNSARTQAMEDALPRIAFVSSK